MSSVTSVSLFLCAFSNSNKNPLDRCDCPSYLREPNYFTHFDKAWYDRPTLHFVDPP